MSWPAMSLYFPSLLNPVIRATINRGLIRRSCSGARPIFSNTPGRKGSIRMSTVFSISLIKANPAAVFVFTEIDSFRRVSASDVDGGRLFVCA